MDNIRQIDLNLLVTLEALLTERSVTRAAKRLALSQPSVSVQLRKLRDLFGDPLLSSVAGAMQPTTRAEALLTPLRAVLDDLRGLLGEQRAFDPAAARVTWQLAASDYAEVALVLPLIARVRRAAPRARVATRGADHAEMLAQLDSGAIDLAFLAVEDVPRHVRHQHLYTEHYVLISRKRHPLLRRPLTVDALCAMDHVLVSPEGGGFRGITDAVLGARGKRRRVAISTQHFALVPELVAQSDLVALVPSRLVRGHAVRVAKPPLAIPSFDMAMVWHERAHADPAHVWLRDQVTLSLGTRDAARPNPD